jgi:hypothetical protein
MYPWASHPKIEDNNQISITVSKKQHIPAKELVEIDLGLILISLPKHHIIKLINSQKKFEIISTFWLPSCNKLTLTIITQKSFQLHPGETLCRLQLLPILHFLPGTHFTSTFPRPTLWLPNNTFSHVHSFIHSFHFLLQNYNQKKRKKFATTVCTSLLLTIL